MELKNNISLLVEFIPHLFTIQDLNILKGEGFNSQTASPTIYVISLHKLSAH